MAKTTTEASRVHYGLAHTACGAFIGTEHAERVTCKRCLAYLAKRAARKPVKNAWIQERV